MKDQALVVVITGPGLTSYPDGPEKQSLPTWTQYKFPILPACVPLTLLTVNYLLLTLDRYTSKTTTTGGYASSAVQILLVSVARPKINRGIEPSKCPGHQAQISLDNSTLLNSTWLSINFENSIWL